MSAFRTGPPNIRMYAGQPDPNDPSRFTIRYEVWGQSDILHMQLLDDDLVTITPGGRPEEPR